MHFGPGHTAGDAAVFFRRDNVVHMGDVFNARYPYIDAANGGSLAGLIAICRSVLSVFEYNWSAYLEKSLIIKSNICSMRSSSI